MKVLLLAGGFGTRLSEETDTRPKPMVEIGGKPILWHIMKIYSEYDFNDFVILLGYKGYYIKEYFANYFLHQSDVTIDMKDGKMEVLNSSSEPWKVTLLDTGLNSMTGGRVKRAQDFIGDEPFMLTYGDGLSNVNIKKLIDFHKKNNKLVSLTAVRPPARFGAIKILGNKVKYFKEKSKLDEGWINGGFFVMQPEFLNYIKNDQTFLEREPMELLTKKNQLVAFKHDNFWQCMDTKRDMDNLNIILKNKNYFE